MRVDISQYGIGNQESDRLATGQQLANLCGGHLQRCLPDEGNLPAAPAKRLGIRHAARGKQIAQCLRRLAAGVRPLQYEDMAVIEQLLPAMPGGQPAEGIPAHHQQQLVLLAQFGAQRYQRVDGIGRLFPLQLTRVHA